MKSARIVRSCTHYLTLVMLVLSMCGAMVLGSGWSLVWADEDDPPQFPQPATFTTLSITPFAIEGLTGDADGNLYTTGRATVPAACPVWQIASGGTPPVTPVQIGSIPNPAPGCNPSGITFDRDGNFYIADANQGGVVWQLTSANMNPTTPFATGVPGTNGLAFDRFGNLWTGDGTTGQGRVWKIAPCAVHPCAAVEMFRIQPMANEVNLVAGVGGVGRDNRALPPGTITVTPTSRNAANTLGSQPLVANGLAFNRRGDLFIADTARGAIWKVDFDRHGNMKSHQTGCDTTFTANTLCLDNVFVAHPLLEGTDGIALDRAGNIWNSANERNAIVVVTKDGRVAEVFRNPVNAAGLRNAADPAVGNNHILEFPTSPFLSGKRFCTSNSDGNRRDNFPNSAGEINSGGPVGARGKISCMNQDLIIPGLPLPVH